MTAVHILQVRSASAVGTPLHIVPVAKETPLVEASGRRAKIWEISPSLHCSIVGTCLSAAELRQLLVKFGDGDARSASDHTLHKRGVLAAGKHDKLGKALQKFLDGKHDRTIKLFAKAETVDDVRALWTTAFDEGNIPSGYWAMMTHPATNRALVEDAFGQIHMLSHMIGSSNRADIQRLRELERQIADRDDKIMRQQARLEESARERASLHQQAEQLLLAARSNASACPDRTSDEPIHDLETLNRRLETERDRAQRLASRIANLEDLLSVAERARDAAQARQRQLEGEIAAVESVLGPVADAKEEAQGRFLQGMEGRTILYVGGRPGLVSHLKGLCGACGVQMLAHDGGIEDGLASLAGHVSRSDLVVFPVDCVSHSAVGIIRKLCRDGARDCIPLRTASVASFLDALQRHAA